MSYQQEKRSSMSSVVREMPSKKTIRYYFLSTRLEKKKMKTMMLYREGNGTPLQYFCLENPMDGGAW